MTDQQVELTPTEVMVASWYGCQRRVNAIRQGRRNRFGDADHRVGRSAWGLDVEGAAAEMAAAKILQRYMPFTIGDTKDDDLNGIHVRSTPYATGHLIVYDDDPADAPFVLMVGVLPSFKAAGWILAGEAKQLHWLDEQGGQYWVPQDQLRSIDVLRLNMNNMNNMNNGCGA